MADDKATAEVVETLNSCEITVNAMGDTAYKVKAYAKTLASACAIAVENADAMKLYATKPKMA